MASVLCITLRFLDPVPQFHGRCDDGDPEWPPSPLRLFQAIVNASAMRWREKHFADYAQPALHWLEGTASSIVTPCVPAKSFGYRMYVPNNSGDLMTAAWARGDTETSMAKYRVEKDVRPTHLQGDSVHYLFAPPDGVCPHFDVLQAAARSITHLGWGVDMVAGNAELLTEEQVAKLPGERWVPSQSGTPLRVPKDGTLADLMRKHKDFLGRLSNGGFKPVPPLREFDTVCYRRATDPERRPFAAFEIHRTIAEQSELLSGKSRFRPFDPVRHTATVAGMVRHAAKLAAESLGWTNGTIESFVCGHGDAKEGQATTDKRLMFLPLPTINPLRVESIRRVLVVGPPGSRKEVDQLSRVLNGAELLDKVTREAVAMLSFLPPADKSIRDYAGESAIWSTVTPVILPGYEDPDHLRKRLRENREAETQKRLLGQLDRRIEGLLRKALRHAGLSGELAESAELQWRAVGFRAGVDLAHRYVRPEKLKKFTAYHMRVRFDHAISGPVAIGAGRYRGMGVFACE